jgi:hypothetical protein
MSGNRPCGSAPFGVARQIHERYDRETKYKGIDPSEKTYGTGAVTSKSNGFRAKIEFPLHTVSANTDGKLFSKNGHEYSHSTSAKFGAMGDMVRSKFPYLLKERITHRTAGVAIAVYAELVCDKGYGHDLKALMHSSAETVEITDVHIFDLAFANPEIYVPLAEKLALVRKTFGEKHAVRTLIDFSKPITKEEMENFEECMQREEGVVITPSNGKEDGTPTKHKTVLPVPLKLVAIGITKYGAIDVPTHFAFAIADGERAGHYTINIIEKAHLFEDSREKVGKVCLKASEVKYNRKEKVYEYTNTSSYVGKNYNAMLAMAKDTIQPKSITPLTAVVPTPEGRGKIFIYNVDRSRMYNFKSATFAFTPNPVPAVLGVNELWVSTAPKHLQGSAHPEIHLQAPQFLASKEYGPELYRILTRKVAYPKLTVKPPKFTYTMLLALAKNCQESRDSREHARIVYGCDVSNGEDVDLVYGKYGSEYNDDDEDYTTPQQSDDESDYVFRVKKFDYELAFTRKRARASE